MLFLLLLLQLLLRQVSQAGRLLVWLLHAEGGRHALWVLCARQGPAGAQLDPLWAAVFWQRPCRWLHQPQLVPEIHR